MRPVLYVICLAALFLSACGGGNAVNFRDNEFNANPGLGNINADAAYARGYFGQGVTVGVIDSGVVASNPEFAGRIVPGRPGQNATTNAMGDHGTNVAGIIGAARNGVASHGVAPSVHIMPLLSGGSGENTSNESFEFAAERNVRILNNSYGFLFPFNGIDTATTTTVAFTGPVLNQLLDAHSGISSNILDRTRRRLSSFAGSMDGEDMVAVWAAGNEMWQPGGQLPVFRLSISSSGMSTVGTVWRTPEYIISNYVIGLRSHNSGGSAGRLLITMRTGITFTANADAYTISAFVPHGVDAYSWAPRYHPQLLGRWLAVIAVDSRRSIAGFSNACGAAKHWCLAAPGVDIPLVSGSVLITASGTSFSAPHVSGALALLKSRFPQMSMSVIVQMLLQTADDLGEAGVDDIYGHGMVNVSAALQAQSNTRMLMANGAPLPLGEVRLPHAFADIGGQIGGVHSAVRYLDDRYYDAPVNVDIAAAPKLSPMRAVDNLWDDDGGGINNSDIDNANFFVRRQGNGALRAAGGNYHQLQLRHHWFGDAPVWNANNDNDGGSRPFFFSAAGGRSSEVIWQFDDSAGIFAARGNEANGDYRQLGLRWQRQSVRLHFSSALSHIREDDTLLGGKFGGAMPLVNGGKTRMAEVSAKWQLHQSGTNKLHLFGNYQHADTDADIGGLASGISGLQARGWQAGITADGIFRGGDKLRFAFGEE
ncbi:MAG: S8 family peptidase, partial [Gammaproteobacteria bacterium]